MFLVGQCVPFKLLKFFCKLRMKKNQNRLEAMKNIEELLQVFTGSETVIFLSGRFSKIVSAVSIQTPYIKKRKSSGFVSSLITKKARIQFVFELLIVHP